MNGSGLCLVQVPQGMGLALDPCCHAISFSFCTCNLIWPPLRPALIAFELDFVGLFSILLIKEASLWLCNEDFVVVPM